MKLCFSLCFYLLVLSLNAQNSSVSRHTISGYLVDVNSSEKLIGANVVDLRSDKGANSNNYGFFSLTLYQDTVDLRFSYVGYQTSSLKFFLYRDTSLLIGLDPTIVLKVVEVTADHKERVEERSQMSRMEIPVDQIKKAPALLGEVDVLKTIQLLPGVQSGGEGQNGLYVRGGSPDQNLILLDGVPVYNASHIGGIFSVFNADAIRNVSLTKGGFPARHGGRLSSIVEINLKDGHMNEFHGEGSIGLISSKLTLETPVVRGTSSLLLSGRRTYIDLLVRPLAKNAAEQEGVKLKPKLHFYDLNLKYNHIINPKHRLYLSAYLGRDEFASQIKEENTIVEGGLDWGNIITSARWNWQISPKLFSNATAIFSDYDFDSSIGVEEQLPGEPVSSFRSKYLSGIQDVGLKWDVDYVPNPSHHFRFGFGATHHTYDPGALTFKLQESDFDLDTLIGNRKVASIEMYSYVEDEFSWGRVKANLGLHASAFVTESTWYKSLQPRFSARYLLPEGWALKGSFNTMVQYINLLTSEALSLPTDLWVPSTKRVKPQKSLQTAFGLAKTLADQFELSVEAYYKKMQDVISFKPGASFLFGFENDWQDKIIQGQGEAYGAELFFQKKGGITSGWIGYTLSWNNRQFDIINSGNPFPFRYDRRHDLSLVVNHDFSKKINASVAWVYGTGNAITLPVSRYYEFQTTGSYHIDAAGHLVERKTLGDKNAFRMSSFHRLDFNISFHKQKKKHERIWSFGAYNAYFHKNPYFVFVSNLEVMVGGAYEVQPRYKEVSVIPFAIPYFSYGFRF